MLIDLHAHSTASDGTDPPAELVAAAREAGLGVVALTDHDTTVGWAAAAAALPAGLTLVPGLELSCRWVPPNGDRPTDAARARLPGRPRRTPAWPPRWPDCGTAGSAGPSG